MSCTGRIEPTPDSRPVSPAISSTAEITMNVTTTLTNAAPMSPT